MKKRILTLALLLVVSLLLPLYIPQVKANPDSTTFSINAGNNDAGKQYDVGYSYTNDREFIGKYGTYNQRIAYRWVSVGISQGSTINNANFSVYKSGEGGGSPKTIIYGFDEDESTHLQSDVWSPERDHTTANVQWDFSGTGTGWIVSPNIASIIQEIVDRPSYTGNVLALFWEEDDDCANNNYCGIEMYEEGYYAQLSVTWTTEEGNTLNFYGEIPLTFTLNHLKTFQFTKQGTIPLMLGFDGTFMYSLAENFLNFFGQIPLAFAVTTQKAINFIRQGAIPLAFTINNQRAISFSREAAIPLAFSVASSFSYSLANILNFYGQIPLNFLLNMQKTVNFVRHGTIPLTLGVSSTFSYSLANWLTFFGSIPLNFAIGMEKIVNFVEHATIPLNFIANTQKTVEFIRQGTIPLAFTFASSFSYSVANLLTFMGSIPLNFQVATEKAVSLIRQGIIPLQFSLESLAHIFQAGVLNLYGLIPLHFTVSGYGPIVAPTTINDVLALAAIAFILALMAISIVAIKKD